MTSIPTFSAVLQRTLAAYVPALARYLAAGQRCDWAGLSPFDHVDRRPLGWIRDDVASRLVSAGLVVADGPRWRLTVRPDADGLHRPLEAAARALYDAGLAQEWRDERYDVRPADLPADPPLFQLERGAFRPLGLTCHAAHLNGWVARDGEPWLWVAQRSASKAVDPGQWDNLAGGGVAAGESADATLVREAWEEGGVPAELSRQTRPLGALLACRRVPGGLQREWLHAYELALPPGFQPANQDGEVAAHACLPLPVLVAQLCEGAFTADAAAVTVLGLLKRDAFGAAGRALYDILNPLR